MISDPCPVCGERTYESAWDDDGLCTEITCRACGWVGTIFRPQDLGGEGGDE